MFKFIAAAAAAVLISSAAYSAYAAEGDYAVILKHEPQVLLADESSGVISRSGRVVVVKSYMDALSLAPASEIECIFEDGIAYLLDTEVSDAPPVNDPSYGRQWGLEAINAPYAWAKGFTGNGVKVGIVDSGMKRPSHADLPIPSLSLNAISNASDYTDYGDNHGHGTKVAGIIGAIANNATGIAGVAYDSELVPIKVTDAKTLSISDMIAGFERAVDFGCQVINMSLGFTENNTPDIAAIGSRIQRAADKGIIVVAAAGNDGNSTYQYPASYDCVVSVASIGTSSSNDAPSTFSQHNDKVTLAAPGYQIYSTNRIGTYGYSDGTSFSAPMVSAAAAIAKQINPAITPDEFIEALKLTSRDVYTTGYDEYTGYGVLDLQALTDYLLKNAPSITPSPVPTATAIPEPTVPPEPTDAPVPEKSELIYDGERYVLTAVHEPFSSQTRIIAAFYEEERLIAVKSAYGIEGNEINKITYPTEASITKAEIFGWDFSDKERPVPVSDKQTVYLSE
ncbi:MAG: S8 family serine peptidase [bacterium]|nr:S8 family serine peptidase [bacterium]